MAGSLNPLTALLDRLRISVPVLQAGMGGGVAGAKLAAAVSEAGGLGTIGILPPEILRKELERARGLTNNPIAVNLLLPFTRPGHWEVAREADVVVTFWGEPVRRTAATWIHQCGSLAEAHAAQAAGADAVIAQGIEAGGHVRGTLPALVLLEQVRAASPDYPVIVAGGIATAADVRTALKSGAAGVAAGTRFLLSDESAATSTTSAASWRRTERSSPSCSASAGSQRVRIPLYGPSAPLARWPDYLLAAVHTS